MAILMEEGNGRRSPFKLVFIVAGVALLVAATYYLFFAPAPFIEVIVPSGLKSVTQIGEKGLNAPAVFDSPVYKNLRQYVAEPETGVIGRSNPFSPWTTRP